MKRGFGIIIFFLTGILISSGTAYAVCNIWNPFSWLDCLRMETPTGFVVKDIGDSCTSWYDEDDIFRDDCGAVGIYCNSYWGAENKVCCEYGKVCCAVDDDCHDYETCIGYACYEAGAPMLDAGATCDNYEDCGPGLTCNADICCDAYHAMTTNGCCQHHGDCLADDYECGPNYYCVQCPDPSDCKGDVGESCIYYYDCRDGLTCENNVCVAEGGGTTTLKPDGETCSLSSQCESGNCRNGVCCDSGKICCAYDSDCPTDYYCGDAVSYCFEEIKDADPGEYCPADENCASGHCVHNTCCASGECCMGDYDCDSSGYTCDKSVYQCVQVGGGKSNGEYCTESAECESWNCERNTCCPYGKACCGSQSHCAVGYVCDPLDYYCAKELATKSNGAICSSDSECASGNCENHVCCSSGQTCCNYDSDCHTTAEDTRSCDKLKYYCVDEEKKGANGASCTYDGDCESQNCNHLGSEDFSGAGGFCCPSGKKCCSSDFFGRTIQMDNSEYECTQGYYLVAKEVKPVCGDGKCDVGEDCSKCSKDCACGPKGCCSAHPDYKAFTDDKGCVANGNLRWQSASDGEKSYCCDGKILVEGTDTCCFDSHCKEGEKCVFLEGYDNAKHCAKSEEELPVSDGLSAAIYGVYLNYDTGFHVYPTPYIHTDVKITNNKEKTFIGIIELYDGSKKIENAEIYFLIGAHTEKSYELDFDGTGEYKDLKAKVSFFERSDEEAKYTIKSGSIKVKVSPDYAGKFDNAEKKGLEDIIKLQESGRADGEYKVEALVLDRPFAGVERLRKVFNLMSQLSGPGIDAAGTISYILESKYEGIYVVAGTGGGRPVPAMILFQDNSKMQREGYKEGDIIEFVVSTRAGATGRELNPGTFIGMQAVRKIKSMQKIEDFGPGAVDGFGFVMSRSAPSDKSKLTYTVSDFDSIMTVTVKGEPDIDKPYAVHSLVSFKGSMKSGGVEASEVYGIGSNSASDLSSAEIEAKQPKIGLRSAIPYEFLARYEESNNNIQFREKTCKIVWGINDFVISYAGEGQAAAESIRSGWKHSTTTDASEDFGASMGAAFTLMSTTPLNDDVDVISDSKLSKEQPAGKSIIHVTTTADQVYSQVEEDLDCIFKHWEVYDRNRDEYYDGCINIVENPFGEGYMIVVLGKNKKILYDAARTSLDNFLRPSDCGKFKLVMNSKQDYMVFDYSKGELY